MPLTQRQKNTYVILIMVGSVILVGITFLFIFRSPQEQTTTSTTTSIDDTFTISGVELLNTDLEKIYLLATGFTTGHETHTSDRGFYHLEMLLTDMTDNFRAETEAYISDPANAPTTTTEDIYLSTEIKTVALRADTATKVTATLTTEQTETRGTTKNITTPTFVLEIVKVGDRWLVDSFQTK